MSKDFSLERTRLWNAEARQYTYISGQVLTVMWEQGKLQKKMWVTALGERGEGESKVIIER